MPPRLHRRGDSRIALRQGNDTHPGRLDGTRHRPHRRGRRLGGPYPGNENHPGRVDGERQQNPARLLPTLRHPVPRPVGPWQPGRCLAVPSLHPPSAALRAQPLGGKVSAKLTDEGAILRKVSGRRPLIRHGLYRPRHLPPEGEGNGAPGSSRPTDYCNRPQPTVFVRNPANRQTGRRAPVTAREERAAAGTSALGVGVGPYERNRPSSLFSHTKKRTRFRRFSFFQMG